MQYSRLERRRNRLSQSQSYLFLAGSVIVIILVVVYGIPAVLGMATSISSWRRGQSKTSTSSATDTTKPMTPQLVESYTATNTADIKITGVADPKISVQLTQNGAGSDSTITDDKGNFSFDVILQKGANAFAVQAISDQGVKSDYSDSYSVAYSSSGPTLSIDGLNEGDTVKNSPINVTGTTDQNATVTVNGRTAIVDANGKYSYYLSLNNGDNKITIVATDQAGNQTKKELTIKYSP